MATPAPMPKSPDSALLAALQEGLPLVSRPYAEIGRRIGWSEAEVIDRLNHWMRHGIIKRMGVVVRHQRLGYVANAMVVWDIPDEQVSEVGAKMSTHDYVTLCYRRPRRGEEWPYNLFCMIHGKDRATVLTQTERLAAACGLSHVPRAVLFSQRCFKQRGAWYRPRLTETHP